jgi:hypothetical protein
MEHDHAIEGVERIGSTRQQNTSGYALQAVRPIEAGPGVNALFIVLLS